MAGMSDFSPFWTPARHRDRRPFLKARAAIRAALRADFAEQDFIEVECGILQHSPGNEAHLHAFETAFAVPGDPGSPVYLHTSPEFSCKKLLTAGERRIVDFARVFRNGEQGPLHAPEFTMVEWYRVGAPYDTVMADAVRLCQRAAAACGGSLQWRDQLCDPYAVVDRLDVRTAFAQFLDIDLDAILHDRDGLADGLRRCGIDVRPDDHWSDLFSRAVVSRIEPNLGQGRLTVLDRYPVAEAALARPCADDKRYAERFELYACGVELANGFGELTDAAEQRRRLDAEMMEKQRIYGYRYPLDEDFLAALTEMPEASGVALGFDRLVMLASGARHINDVLWTPFPVAAS